MLRAALSACLSIVACGRTGRPDAGFAGVGWVCPPRSRPKNAQRAHAKGSCGSLGPGTGLRDTARAGSSRCCPASTSCACAAGGEAYLTVAKLKSMDFFPGQPVYITVEGAPAGATLEWKTPVDRLGAGGDDLFSITPSGPQRPQTPVKPRHTAR